MRDPADFNYVAVQEQLVREEQAHVRQGIVRHVAARRVKVRPFSRGFGPDFSQFRDACAQAFLNFELDFGAQGPQSAGADRVYATVAWRPKAGAQERRHAAAPGHQRANAVGPEPAFQEGVGTQAAEDQVEPVSQPGVGNGKTMGVHCRPHVAQQGHFACGQAGVEFRLAHQRQVRDACQACNAPRQFALPILVINKGYGAGPLLRRHERQNRT